MKYTNKHNVPVEIIRALKNDQYSKGESVISVTGLLQPPRIRLLNDQHQEQITVDYSDEVWKLLGQGIHAVLERANENHDDTVTEQRYFADVHGWTISGQTDSLAKDENTLKASKRLKVPKTLLLIKFLASSMDLSTCVSAAKLKIQTGLCFINILNIFSLFKSHLINL